jgi:ring-1,2-phenylacetyl-CoA epoxidase subunit PaaC
VSTDEANPAKHEHDTVYDGLLVNDAHWAFGTDFEDPLAGVDTTVPGGIDASDLAAYCLMLGDDALVLSQRLAEWSGRAPDLEEDIALTNIALDLLGQARLLLARAAAADPAVVPAMPSGSPVPPEDALAYFREESRFRNVRLVEMPNGDFAETIVRLLLFSTYRLALFERLAGSPDAVLAAVAAKGVKELTYHRDFSGRWFLTLAKGTAESRRRLLQGLDQIWPLKSELFETHEVDARLGVDLTAIEAEVDVTLEQVFSQSDVDRPELLPLAGVRHRKGRDGLHTEALSQLLAELQVVARAHPMGRG